MPLQPPDAPHHAAAGAACPNCREQMQVHDLARRDQGTVPVYVCFPCAGFWFDHFASVQLAPAAVIQLFREIHEHRDGARQSLEKQLACPRCHQALALSFDLGKTGRFSYFSCHRGDGRFTPFFQFLREKQFVRNLTAPEIDRLRLQVKQVACSDCGAPIDLAHDSACSYCHAPVSFLDPDAVEKAMHFWSAQDARRSAGPTPQAVADAILRTQAALAPAPLLAGPYAGGRGPDLVALGIDVIGSLLRGL